jgi:hypothetical protein
MIYGVDLGMRSLYIYGDDGPRVITVPKSDRYTEIWRMSEEIFEAFHVEDLIFYEEPVLAGPKNIRTVIGLAQTSGCLLASSVGKCYEVPVATWKKEIVGKGNAKKQDVADWLLEHDGDTYSGCGGDQNFMDAACIHKYGKMVMGRLSSST